MSSKVLVLNADYSAISICDIQRAFILLYLEKAIMIETVTGEFIRTVYQSFEYPSVIKLHSYVKTPYRQVSLTKTNIFKRDGYRCVYCSSKDFLTLDHVVPKSKGGPWNWSNLVTACHKCNSIKGDKCLHEANLNLKLKPFKPSFVMFVKQFKMDKLQTHWTKYLGS